MDLRIHDNPALYKAIELGNKLKSSPVLAVYIISPADLLSHKVSKLKVDFLLRNLRKLSEELFNSFKIPLIVRLCSHEKNHSEKVLTDIVQEYKASHLLFNIEYEIDEYRRDERIFQQHRDIQIYRFHDQTVVPPGLLKSASGNVYTVYTPYKRSWFELVKKSKDTYLKLYNPKKDFPTFNNPSRQESLIPDSIPDHVEGFALDNQVLIKMKGYYPEGEEEAFKRLEEFCKGKIMKYKSARDFPAVDGTSSLSPYLASGIISAKQCVDLAMKSNDNKLDIGSEGAVTWIQEIIWRDFYRSILFSYPRVCMNKPFKLATAAVPWLFNEELFNAWKLGKTGYPIVDAGMRQLNETGWMHNRLRMIVASFLSKHLLHNWQLGESYFMEKLIDCDFASNNGGWQWAASTGTDSQPYFRVFNPLLQSKKFDPEGKFIKHWVPELRSLKNVDNVHDPSTLGKSKLKELGYPDRIVEHEMARKRAIEAFKSLQSVDGQESNSPKKRLSDKTQEALKLPKNFIKLHPIVDSFGTLWVSNPAIFPIDGLTYIPNFLTKEEQDLCVSLVDSSPYSYAISRRQQFWGKVYYHTTHDIKDIQPASSDDSGLDLEKFRWLLDKLDRDERAKRIPETIEGDYTYQKRPHKYSSTPKGLFRNDDGEYFEKPNQILVNEYVSVQSISHHIDDPYAFGKVLVMISLVSPVYMTLTRPQGFTKCLLEPGSLLVMKGVSRHDCLHKISRAKWIFMPDGEAIERTEKWRRLSLTIREVLEGRKKVEKNSEEWVDEVLSR